jgi:two-component system phosphate regulon response regulator PhoB
MAYLLSRAGYAIRTAESGPEVLDICRVETPSLVLLGLSLARLSGMTVLRRLRAQAATQAIPVIALGASPTEKAAISAFEAGADDYLTVEPFRGRELVWRVGAVLRRARARGVPSDQILQVGALRLDCASRRVTLAGREINLTPTETSMLFLLADGTLLDTAASRVSLGRRRRTKVIIQRIRVKLGTACDIIETVRGLGYRLRTSDTATT